MADDANLNVSLTLKDGISAPLDKTTASVQKLDAALKSVSTSGTKSLGTIGKTAGDLSDAFGGLSGSIGGINNSTEIFLRKSATLTNRLLGIAVAVQGLGGREGVLKAASEGLSVFAGAVMAMPSPIGVAIGAIGGLAVGIRGYTQEQKEAAEAMKKFQAQLQAQTDKINEARAAWKISIATAKNPELAATESGINTAKEAMAHQLKLLDDARVAMAQAGNPLSEAFLKAKDSADEAEANIIKLKASLDQLETDAERLQLDDKIKDAGLAADVAHEKVMQGLITPLEGAQDRLKATETALDALIRMKDKLDPGAYSDRFDKLTASAGNDKAIISADKIDRELDAAREHIKGFEIESGIGLSKETEDRLAALGIQSKAKLKEALDEIKKETEGDPLKGLELSLADLTKQSYSFRDAWKNTFADLQRGFSDAFANAILSGKKFGASFKELVGQLKSDLVHMLTDSVTSGLMKMAAGGLMSILSPGSAGAAPVATVAGSSNNVGGGGGGFNIGSIGSAVGLGGSTSLGGDLTLGGLGAGLAVGGIGASIAAQGISSGNRTQGTVGGLVAGAALGATIGSVIPGIGTVVGGIVGGIAGGIAGFFGSSRKRRKKRREAAAAAAAAAAAQAAAEEKARGVIMDNLRTRYGGGLGTEDEMGQIGALLSGGISSQEIASLGGASQIAAQASSTTNKTVNVGGVTLNVSANVSGSYDAAQLAQDLGLQIAGSIRSAAAGL